MPVSGGKAFEVLLLEASSGSNQEKFNGDYCGDSDPFTSPTSACFTLTALPGNPTLVKSVDKAVAVEGETLTYNLAYENTSTNSVGDPSSGNGIVIRDSIPSGIDYVAGSASCSAACTIRYSSDNGLTFESVEPSPASLVTDLHFYLSDPIPGGATGTVTFQGIVETGFTGRITNIGEIAITGSAAITTDNAETLVGCEFDSDCDDGAYCNGAETCVSGACTAGTPVSCDDGQACTTESCNEATDSCDYTTNDAVCDDADACNGAETCVAGVGCQAGTPLVCDDSNECTTDSCNAIAGCQYANASAGTACGDGTDNDCTDPDTCDGAGSCQSNHASAGANAPTQCNDSVECTADQCDGSGGCQNPNLSAGTACGDGSDTDCTNPDTCDGAGSCQSNHESSGFNCGDGTNTDCTDPDTCDGAGTCQSNHASAGAAAATQCNDSNECTLDQCDGAGGCQNPAANAGTTCGDGTDNDCTDPDTCDGSGSCQSNHASAGTTAATQCNDSVECTADQCDGAGGCQNPAASAGTPCGDGTNSDCTDPDTCDGAGTCQSNHASAGTAAATQCDDSQDCTADQCDGTGGCQYANASAGTACGDGTDNDCTDPDTCDGAGSCQSNHASAGANAPTQCNDSVECTADQCDGSGGCQNPNLSAGTACGDGSDTDCTNPDTCDGAGSCQSNHESSGFNCGDGTNTDCTDPDTCDGAGTCQSNHASAGAAAATQCNDSNECTLDQCDGAGGCQNPAANAGTTCGDGTDNDCTDPDTCDGSGSCQSNHASAGTTAATQCNDSVECTADQCDGAGGCQNPAASAGTPCGDGTNSDCTDPDTCDGAGTCQSNHASAGTAAATQCDDSQDCTADQCDGTGGCQYANAPAGISCGDPSDTECTDPDTCDGAGGCTSHDQPSGTVCGDQSSTECTLPDTCNALGICQPNDAAAGTSARSLCNDLNTCTRDQCDGTGGCRYEALASGRSCNDPADDGCDTTPDTCDGTGVCQANEPAGNTDCTFTDLALEKLEPVGTAELGGFVDYLVRVSNLGPNDAGSVVVTDYLDPNTAYVASTPPCVEEIPGRLTCPLGSLVVGATIEFGVTVRVNDDAPTAGVGSGSPCPVGSDLCNRAIVSSDRVDTDWSNNEDEAGTDATPITQSADLLTTKVDITPEPVAPGDQVLYEIRVTNLGPDEATDVVLHESLDPHMIYVSDSHGCSASGTPTQLTCALGNIANGASVVFQVTVDIDPNSPIASGLQDGDCYNAEDLCNTVTVSARTSDPSLDNNHDSEPTDASTNPTCGDGIINGADQCDPPSAETCTNGVDDNGDNLIDCADPLCAYPATSCDGNCQLTTACLPILDDPAKLTWNYVKIHGRFVPGTPVDPENEGFTFMLSNANGLIYRAELFAADLRFAGGKSTKRWKFRDKFAKRGMGSRKGLSTISMKTRNEPDGSVSYPFKVKAYGDMSNATVALMTTQISVGDDVSFVTAEWKGKPGHWRLYKSQF